MAMTNLHGWKWIGAPQSGVLGLFAPLETPLRDNQNPSLPNEPSRVSQGSLNTAPSTPIEPPDLPLSLRLVLLGVELVMAFAAALLSVWCANTARVIARSVLGPALADFVYTAVFGFGVITFYAKLFHQNDRVLLLQRLGLFWSPLSAVLVSVVLHSASLLFLKTDLSTFPLRTVVLAPIEEELFFRALVLHIALHRLRAHVLHSAIVSSVGFALVHVANARRVSSSSSFTPVGLLVQVAWAAVVGLFLALRCARKGSLLECMLLHIVNNVFAAVKHHDAETSCLLAFVWIGLYAVASIREARHIRVHRTP